MELLKEIYGELPKDKIKINWNKKPIKMKEFLSFLTVKVDRCIGHMGHDTGWTQHVNDKSDLIIRGGIVQGVEYLDCIQYGEKLSNPYNNYVNPFFLWDILDEEGLDFFKKYYSEDISEFIAKVSKNIKIAESKLEALTVHYDKIKHLKE